jgi:predicted permease
MSVELAQNDIVFDHRVVLFAVGTSVVAALVSGVLPALRAPVDNPAQVLRAGRTPGSRRSGRSGLAVVGLELALATVLLCGAGAVTAAFLQEQAEPLGYQADGLLTLRASLPTDRYPGEASRNRAVQALADRIGALPGVAAAGVQTGNPARGGWVVQASTPERSGLGEGVEAYLRFGTPGVLESLGVPIVAGRALDERDREGPPAAVVSRSLARRLWGGPREALGRELLLPGVRADATEWRVVGVSGDVREQGDVRAAVYVPYTRHLGRLPAQEIDFFVRSASGDAVPLAPEVRAAVHEVDPDLALYGVESQAEVRTAAQALERAGATLAAGLVGFGLLLSAIGVFGVVSNLSARARRSIGVRKALGAGPATLVGATLGPTVRAVLGGIAVGIGGAWLSNRVLGLWIAELPAPDARLYALVAVVLGLVALAAAVGPAARAILVDPVRVLRSD